MFDDALDDTPVLTAHAPFVPPAALCRDVRDIRHYQVWTRAYAYTLCAALAAALLGLIPAWLLVLVVPLAYVRLALALHELLHACPPSRLPR